MLIHTLVFKSKLIWQPAANSFWQLATNSKRLSILSTIPLRITWYIHNTKYEIIYKSSFTFKYIFRASYIWCSLPIDFQCFACLINISRPWRGKSTCLIYYIVLKCFTKLIFLTIEYTVLIFTLVHFNKSFIKEFQSKSRHITPMLHIVAYQWLYTVYCKKKNKPCKIHRYLLFFLLIILIEF